MNSNEEILAGRDYLVAEQEWMAVPLTVFGNKYTLIVTRRNKGEYFRASANALEDIYTQIKGDFKGIKDISIEIMPAPLAITPSYCVVPVRLVVDGKEYDVQVGETKISSRSPDSDRENPFSSALRKARTKCIASDLLDLPSRFFDENGAPIVYFEDKGAEKKAEVKEEPAPALNSVEEEELAKLAEVAVPYRIAATGETGCRKLSECNDKWLKLYAGETNKNEDLRAAVARYAELKKKKEGAA